MIGSALFVPFKTMNSLQKKNILFIVLVSFVVLFSYPIIRSTVDSLFLDVVGAKKSPLVWLYAVFALALTVSIYNKFQARVRIQTLFLVTSLLTFFVFVIGLYFMSLHSVFWAYLLFVLKEVYIVLLLHMGIGLLNETVDYKVAKTFYGPLGGVNGLAGILGGLLTSWLTYSKTTEAILFIGALFLPLSAFLFWKTSHINFQVSSKEEAKNSPTPFQSIKPVASYVFWIVMIVALSQVCISLVNFKFNILFEQMVPDKTLKTRYLGDINAIINALNLGIQLLVVPLSLRFVSNRVLQLLIPTCYGFVAIWGFGFGVGTLFPIATTFIIFKGVDYSLFSVLKELLYFPLKVSQKYGAKYIVDMVVYRFAKGFISFILIFWQSALFIDYALATSLLAWGLCLIPLFKEQKKILGGQI